MVLRKSVKHATDFCAQDFSLAEPLTGRTVTLSDVRGSQGTLVIFTCVNCPFSVHLKQGFADISVRAKSLGIGVVDLPSITFLFFTTKLRRLREIMARYVRRIFSCSTRVTKFSISTFFTLMLYSYILTC